jgi:methyl-accepting chemotaxis protein
MSPASRSSVTEGKDMATNTQDRRKQLFVNRPMQGRIILNIALVPGIALGAIAVFTAIYCTRLMDEAMATDSELPSLLPMFYLVIAFELLAGTFLVFNSVRMSHKIAGPAYRIVKSLERMRGGDLTFKVALREGDLLGEIRDELNKTLDWLNENPPAGCVTRQAAKAREAAATPPAPVETAQQSTV